MEIKATVPTISIAGKYTVDGKVFVLPISGNGDIDANVG